MKNLVKVATDAEVAAKDYASVYFSTESNSIKVLDAVEPVKPTRWFDANGNIMQELDVTELNRSNMASGNCTRIELGSNVNKLGLYAAHYGTLTAMTVDNTTYAEQGALLQKLADKSIATDGFAFGFNSMSKTMSLDVITTGETVDLGLPSGMLWATCNVGASTATEYGKYFQWGDTVGYEGDGAKAHSTWATAPFNNGSSSFNKNYFTSNSGTWLTSDAVLKPEHDAAHVIMGGDWRMPTSADTKELVDNTVCGWVTVKIDDTNTVGGYVFFKKGDHTKNIFIPAAGSVNNSRISDVGNHGYVWSSSLFSISYPISAYYLNFYSYEVGPTSESDRYYACPVRGVIG